MKYQIYVKDNRATLEIHGNIFSENLQDFRNALNHVAEKSCNSIVLDLLNVGAITSYGLRELIVFENQMSKLGKTINIINASQIISDLISIAKKVYV